ncbi:MAG: MBL fold metallo-hydrolase [archaeon]|jgi:L-ascorbate metabolism protein UlaG (beta-lactamase superfamily)|nr:MBL fold metallo-hydrolase [archaeon]
MKVNGVEISFLGHSGFLILNGKKIAIDPYNVSEKVNEKVDLILITHSHYDHCSIKDIQKLARKGTIIVVPADAQSKITRVEDVEMQIIEVGDELEFEDVKINAVPAYNIDKNFHPKSEGWMGYVIKMGSAIIYHAGDTDKIPDIQKLTGYAKDGNQFVVILPVSGTYVMTAEEAADVASLLNPTVAIPMHYGAGVAGTIEDAQRFVNLCKEVNVRAEILEKI